MQALRPFVRLAVRPTAATRLHACKLRPMSSLSVIHTDKAPAAVGPYSQAIKANGMLYVSGCLGLDPKTGNFPSTEVDKQAAVALENMAAVLKAGGSSFDKVVKVSLFLTDINDFAKVNAVYAKYFGNHKPARSTYAVKALPKGGIVELEAIAVADK